jgi:hypothetical protein
MGAAGSGKSAFVHDFLEGPDGGETVHGAGDGGVFCWIVSQIAIDNFLVCYFLMK